MKDSTTETGSPHTISLPDPRPGHVCQSCGSPGQEQYCPRCGQRIFAGRHTLQRFGRDVMVRTWGEEGFLRTAVQLSTRPGSVIGNYLAGRTAAYVNPVAYLLVAAVAFTAIGRAIGGSTGAAESDRILALLIIPFIAAFSRAFYWRGPYNLAEHLIIVFYLSAQVLVLLAVFYMGVLIVPSRLTSSYAFAAVTAGIVFFVWGYSRAIDGAPFRAALAAMLSIILGAAAWLLAVGAVVGLLRR